MPAEQEMQRIKGRIAEVYAQREALKRALELGTLPPRDGFARLEATDRELSDLDLRFKGLWDATQARAPFHPATTWAMAAALDPVHVDCVTAIMLKILDAKCKMGETEKQALAAVYDVVRTRPGQGLGDAVHTLIARARAGDGDPGLPGRIHDERVRAESFIPKPVMKGFKALLQAALPRH